MNEFQEMVMTRKIDDLKQELEQGLGGTASCSVAMLLLTLHGWKEAVVKDLGGDSNSNVWLRATSAITAFDEPSSTDWVDPEPPVRLPIVKLPPPRHSPAVRCLQAGINSDLVIECEGKEFQVHSFILKCNRSHRSAQNWTAYSIGFMHS